MTPLSATDLATHLGSATLQPDRKENPGVVQITLRGVGASHGLTVGTIRQFITALMGGFPIWDHPTPGSGARNMVCRVNNDPAAGVLDSSNLNPNGYFDAGITGYTQSKATGSQAHDAVNGLFAAGCLEQTCPGTNAQEGAQLSTSIVVPAASRVVASAWFKSVSGSTSLRVALTERDAADAVVTTTNVGVTAVTTGWRNGFTNKQFGATGVKANVSVCTAGTTAAVFLVDAVVLAVAHPEAFTTVDGGENTASGFTVHVIIRNHGRRTFDPDRIYVIADQLWGTVTSDKDEQANGIYELNIAA